MIEFTKDDFKSKEELEYEIKKYSDHYNGITKGPRPIVKKTEEIHKIVMNNEEYSFIDKTKKEINLDKQKEKEEELKQSYINDHEKWLNEKVRPIKNYLLLTTDYLMLEDSGLSESQKSDLIQYRRLLKDFTENLTYTEEIEWPSKPSFIH